MGQVRIPEPGEELRPPPTNLVQGPTYLRTTGPIRRAKGGWTLEEDDTLKRAVELYKGKCWKKIAEFFPDRSEVQCLHRWQKVLNPELVKGLWTQEEDDTIIELVLKYGPTKWSVIAKFLPELFNMRNTSVPSGHGATWCQADLGRPNMFWTAQICLSFGGRFGNFKLKNYPNKSGPSKTSLDGRDRARHHLAPYSTGNEKFLLQYCAAVLMLFKLD
ncbi:hypothetical protein RHMOL_Rhmol13G0127000 [Rhododendron molle]|uniref:Uncharacterized protein n=1 Tax=Rhododendron molle TaxID=49168 RepID=A0ACC0L6J7_RHOML|nr:hypothetical protein RHMOL_Rhmol13G0127000 [Rhododendron molle]